MKAKRKREKMINLKPLIHSYIMYSPTLCFELKDKQKNFNHITFLQRASKAAQKACEPLERDIASIIENSAKLSFEKKVDFKTLASVNKYDSLYSKCLTFALEYALFDIYFSDVCYEYEKSKPLNNGLVRSKLDTEIFENAVQNRIIAHFESIFKATEIYINYIIIDIKKDHKMLDKMTFS